MIFPVVMYRCESWTIKKVEHQRIDAFKLWCCRRLFARRPNQSILREINHEQLLEGLMLKLKLQYFGHLMQITDALERPGCWERLKAAYKVKPAAAAAAKSLQSCPTLCDHIDGSPPGSLSLGFSRQKHWSGLPFF